MPMTVLLEAMEMEPFNFLSFSKGRYMERGIARFPPAKSCCARSAAVGNPTLPHCLAPVDQHLAGASSPHHRFRGVSDAFQALPDRRVLVVRQPWPTRGVGFGGMLQTESGMGKGRRW